jgi:hypothetical protein
VLGNPIFLNDFVDGALVEHAIKVSKQRAEPFLRPKTRSEVTETEVVNLEDTRSEYDRSLTPEPTAPDWSLTSDSMIPTESTPSTSPDEQPRGPAPSPNIPLAETLKPDNVDQVINELSEIQRLVLSLNEDDEAIGAEASATVEEQFS